ncbi:MAG: ATP-binding cassette domain-containing protein [Ilumatobacteraceae bacterium]
MVGLRTIAALDRASVLISDTGLARTARSALDQHVGRVVLADPQFNEAPAPTEVGAKQRGEPDGHGRVRPGGTDLSGDVTPALDRLDLEIDDGEFLVLVGPSGCGKSTTLRMLAGLEPVDRGRIDIGDRDVTMLPARERDIAMVFQSYALYPHMTVAENIGFHLKIKKVPKHEIARRVKEAADLLDLGEYLDRKPAKLSGGQRQRVAMGRAIVRQPSVFLMDEPLSNLDAKLRVQTRTQIAALQRRLGSRPCTSPTIRSRR